MGHLLPIRDRAARRPSVTRVTRGGHLSPRRRRGLAVFSPPEWALGSSRKVWIAYPACVFKGGQRTDSRQSQSSLAIEEASAPFDLHEWSFW